MCIGTLIDDITRLGPFHFRKAAQSFTWSTKLDMADYLEWFSRLDSVKNEIEAIRMTWHTGEIREGALADECP